MIAGALTGRFSSLPGRCSIPRVQQSQGGTYLNLAAWGTSGTQSKTLTMKVCWNSRGLVTRHLNWGTGVSSLKIPLDESLTWSSSILHTERFLTRRGGGTHWEEIQIALSVLTEEIHAEHDVLGIHFIETDTKIHIIKRNNLPSEIRILLPCYH